MEAEVNQELDGLVGEEERRDEARRSAPPGPPLDAQYAEGEAEQRCDETRCGQRRAFALDAPADIARAVRSRVHVSAVRDGVRHQLHLREPRLGSVARDGCEGQEKGEGRQREERRGQKPL